MRLEFERVVAQALAEDIGAGDVTSATVIPEALRFSGVMASRQPMVVAGLPGAEAAFRALVPDLVWRPRVQDGDQVAEGAVIAEVAGSARGLLSAERVALNLLQHLSGIATLTRAYVQAIEGCGAQLLDTRKTVPGLRLLAKYATRMGGARNHRMGLFDAVLIKDNHIAVCGGVAEAVRRARAGWDGVVEVECDTLAQVAEALAAGADILLLDNMTPAVLREAVALAKGRARTEASGGVTLDTIRAIAETGVDFVSVGRITQSAPAVDIGLDWAAET
ncbi:MAG: carboxylating nicotinate-nucleotide diphosphorylase [Alphaproteobacteria bacterium]|nr:carboxylating nicotinate-nucleotide diphosphorylase [Alphaproteobacteria bacterium]